MRVVNAAAETSGTVFCCDCDAADVVLVVVGAAPPPPPLEDGARAGGAVCGRVLVDGPRGGEVVIVAVSVVGGARGAAVGGGAGVQHVAAWAVCRVAQYEASVTKPAKTSKSLHLALPIAMAVGFKSL